ADLRGYGRQRAEGAGRRSVAQGPERAHRQDREHAVGELRRAPAAGRPVRRRGDHRGAQQLAAWSGRGRRILSRPLLRRYALGLWFCAIAALGLLQFRLRALEGDVFDPTPVAWIWLAGSCVLACVGVALIVRARRR